MAETQAMLISEELGSQINVRSGPSTATNAPAYGFAGDQVTLLAQSTDSENYTWYQVRFDETQHVGWVREDFITTETRSVETAQPVQPEPSPVAQQLPIRDPVSGSCDCPYDRMSNGRTCGGNSAYSRPGGASPVCYTTDQ